MRLHINIDHVATVRQARRTDEPDPVRAAVFAEMGGADGITVHLREDRRHINDRDLRLLVQTVRTGINLELAPHPDAVEIAAGHRLLAVTLVPENRQEVTTEGGLDLGRQEVVEHVRAALDRLHERGMRTSLFIGPEPGTLEMAARLRVSAVELHTGEYAERWKRRQDEEGREALAVELQRLRQAAAQGRALGLAVHAGHGLTYENVAPVARIPEIEELNIGHSVISRAVLVGLERAVREMKTLLLHARAPAAATP